ncbi:gamma-glutamyltransferase [Janibacter sp. Soil728]|uniref:gamma-glutamyltransferase n=1 Tax=Janibacter sp. Soil728 TaxID=1736393 RepID=UPI0006F2C72C|nr:gamma-glutamyltransferase [Janibacter sp. Soil728]KRE37900.1 gamma-glutamyltransferase [Janibacter sp. Soil728]
MGRASRFIVGALTAGGLTLAATSGATATPEAGPPPVGHDLPKVPVMRGGGGAVASVDPIVSQIGIDILERGGNAADAAVGMAAAVGVVEPYTSGLGGGGFFVHYDAATGQVETIDGRETAPATFHDKVFVGDDGQPMDFDTVVNSGLSVGVPGTPATWEMAAERYGTKSLNTLLKPAEMVARKGFVVDQPFHDATVDNAERFAQFPDTAKIYLPGGEPIKTGAILRNPDLAKSYRLMRTHGADVMQRGELGEAVVDTARNPRTAPGVSVPRGQITMDDMRAYRALVKEPTHSEHKGLDVYGMPLPSSGGIAVSEILNLLESYEERTGRQTEDLSEGDWAHWFAEASATAFADRNRYVGDVPGVPAKELVSQGFADERSCLFHADEAMTRPVPFGTPDGSYGDCQTSGATTKVGAEDQHTTSLTAVDKEGDAVTYTLTIEQYGGSGMVVPGYGFLLNNELTDFNFTPVTQGVPDPNLPGPGKRPRSSMSPTIVLKDGKPWMTAGSPGGATIITTVAQLVAGVTDRGMPIGDSLAAPRISSRNGTSTQLEPLLADGSVGEYLTSLGHTTTKVDRLGNATGIRVHDRQDLEAAAEPTRAGGGSAMVVDPE